MLSNGDYYDVIGKHQLALDAFINREYEVQYKKAEKHFQYTENDGKTFTVRKQNITLVNGELQKSSIISLFQHLLLSWLKIISLMVVVIYYPLKRIYVLPTNLNSYHSHIRKIHSVCS